MRQAEDFGEREFVRILSAAAFLNLDIQKWNGFREYLKKRLDLFTI